MKKQFLATLIVAIAAMTLLSCGGQKSPDSYSISGTLPGNVNADWMYLYAVDGPNPVVIDSVRIKNNAFCIEGVTPDTATIAFLHPGDLNDNPAIGWNLFLEPAALVADTNDQFVSGGPLNDGMKNWMTQLTGIFETGDVDEISGFLRANWSEHSSDLVGPYFLATLWPMLDFNFVDSLAQTIAPELQQLYFVRLNLLEPLQATREMQPGNPFKDFELETLDGEPVHFSDYVGKGDYVLVDFWAPWCGPCRQAMPELQSVVKKYKKLKVIGIAVNDKLETIKQSANNLGITWPVLSDKAVVSGRLYGFNAIPFMMLFGPDGTIIARDFHTDTLDTLLSENLK